MKEGLYEDFNEEKEEKTDYRELFFKYYIHWTWFAASLIICLLCAWIYLRYTTPVYNISAAIIVRDDKKGGDAATSALSMFEDMGIMPSSQNIDNEIEIMQSKSLIKEVVNELNLHITYFSKGTINNEELYCNSPIHVSLPTQEADKLPSGGITFHLNYQPDGKLEVKTTIKNIDISKEFSKVPAVLSTEIGTFNFSLDSTIRAYTEPISIDITIKSPLRVARAYSEALTIEPTSKTTSVARISLKNTNRQRGEDFINKLIDIYNRSTNDDKNEMAKKTEEFIRERIGIINTELGTTEQELETFKRDAGVTDVGKDAELAATEKSGYEKLVSDNGIQINLVQYLENYLNNPKHANDVIPSNVGLTDNNLSQLINQYNEIVLERNRLLRASSETNPVVTRLNSSIHDMHVNLKTTINSVLKGLLITKTDLNYQTSKYAGRISDAPKQERQLVSIQRQQEIKSGLYLMLLQKREENAIALAATTNNARIIDNATPDEFPVSPKKRMVYLIALILGLGLPVGGLYIKDLLSYRIGDRQDVEKLTAIPIVGDVALANVTPGETHPIVVRENDNNIMAETFRTIRTNVLFMLGDSKKKVILVTSTTIGEGKTFIASNLAVSLSLLGKKVLLIGLDIRKPGLNKVFHISHKEQGFTQYLANQEGTDLFSLVRPSKAGSNLYVLPSGLIPPNPTELVSRQTLDEAITLLSEKFDYIVLDTAPIGMVTDTQIIGRVADLSIYVCRADYTSKNDFKLINELNDQKRLPQLCTVINGLDMTKKKYGYFYGYGKYGKAYGYGKRYGYGNNYGYGYEHLENKESENEKK